MQINGYQLREAIKRWELRRETAGNQFQDSLTAFGGEQKASPDWIMKDFNFAADAVAKLQFAQAYYNISNPVNIKCGNKAIEMRLCEAIRRVADAGRAEKMWRVAAGAVRKDRYAYSTDHAVRSKDNEYAQRTISVNEALSRAAEAGAFASALRAAMAEANAFKLDLDLDENLINK